MNIFQTILQKLGFPKPATPPPTLGYSATPAPKPAGASSVGMSEHAMSGASGPATAAPAMPAAAPKPAPMAMVDVVSKLEEMAVDNPGLDWKVSIVDLLKLLGIDSGLSARKELAHELGCPPELVGGDYAKMNIWLHKTVLQKIAENGGNIPKELLS